MLIYLLLGLATAALVLSAVALRRSYVPPQQRKVLELQGRVEDLEFAYEQTSQRLTKRAKTENMEKAREAHTERSARRDRIESEALAILDAAKAPQGPPQQGNLLPVDPSAAKAALRSQLLVVRKP